MRKKKHLIWHEMTHMFQKKKSKWCKEEQLLYLTKVTLWAVHPGEKIRFIPIKQLLHELVPDIRLFKSFKDVYKEPK